MHEAHYPDCHSTAGHRVARTFHQNIGFGLEKGLTFVQKSYIIMPLRRVKADLLAVQ